MMHGQNHFKFKGTHLFCKFILRSVFWRDGVTEFWKRRWGCL